MKIHARDARFIAAKIIHFSFAYNFFTIGTKLNFFGGKNISS